MFVAVVHGNNGTNSGLKQNRDTVEIWAKNQLENTKAQSVYILEAVAVMSVAPRTIVTQELKKTEPDVKCETCDPVPLTNGSLTREDYYADHKTL